MTLHTKYRPTTFHDVVGNATTVASLKNHLEQGTQRSFLFHGPPGTGKTTLARLVKVAVKAIDIDCVEFNAGADTGVDAARHLLEMSRYMGMGPEGTKVFILDEVQMLSKNAWNALLKQIEEPPYWAYWCLCTTDFAKIPKAIRSRCAIYSMERLTSEAIASELGRICDCEGWVMADDVLDMVAQGGDGCLRAAITMLADVHGMIDPEIVKRMVSGYETTDELGVIDFCRAIMRMKGCRFQDVQKELAALSSVAGSEGLRRVIVAYFAKVAIGARNAAVFGRAACVLDAFGKPYGVDAGIGPLVVSTRDFLVALQKGS